MMSEKPLDVSDIDEWVRASEKEKRDAHQEAYDYTRKFVVRGKLFTDTPICIEASQKDAGNNVGLAYVYVVI